jgi:small subunit ribosomal protein S11
MGKKRIIKKSGKGLDQGRKERALAKVSKKHLEKGILHIEATFNNTKATLTDEKGNAVVSSSAGALGFSGARKSTPYAAAKVGELIGEKGAMIGLKEATVIIRGVGAGRESALRAFVGKGIQIKSIKDATPIPHNGPRPPKPRRV